ncbi:hypothetical protein FQA39_LY16816 [Lamprigera yunnana]|nr:hypothetical protein FQA39_LY16816 [Lamprigera yunnana]
MMKSLEREVMLTAYEDNINLFKSDKKPTDPYGMALLKITIRELAMEPYPGLILIYLLVYLANQLTLCQLLQLATPMVISQDVQLQEHQIHHWYDLNVCELLEKLSTSANRIIRKRRCPPTNEEPQWVKILRKEAAECHTEKLGVLKETLNLLKNESVKQC